MLPFCSDIAGGQAKHDRRTHDHPTNAETVHHGANDGTDNGQPNIDAAYDRDACERPQPNSAASGLTKTPAVALNKGAYPASIPRAAPRITLT
jgi:hypothetical protein